MTLFIAIVWLATIVAAFMAGYKLRKPIEKTEDSLKASAGDLANKTAGKVAQDVQDAAKKVT